jgi:acetolactate synthase I/II/III large subunit
MNLDGGQALIKSLEMEGVETIFGLPGGAILPVYDPIIDSPIRHVLVRHEQGAGHMAEGFAHATGRPGVAMVTSGPGATNIVTPICDAYMDSVPMVVITGQVATSSLGTDAFQEADITGITQGITKHNFLVTEAQDIPRVIREAFHIATTGRPGPVLVDVPKDIVDPKNPRSAMQWYWPESVDLPGYHPVTHGDPALVRQAAELILASHRPVIYAGGGILKARAAEALRELAELCDIHVVTTLMARGAFPDDHPLALGMPGMHGNYTAVTSMQQSDLLIALGSRFDDRVTGKLDGFAPEAKVIHVDIDPAEIGKVRRPDVGIVGDCRLVIEEIISAVRHLGGSNSFEGLDQPDRSAWKSRLSGWRETYPLTYQPSEPGDALKPQFVLETLRDNTPDDCIVASGVGQHQMWTSQHWKFNHPYTWVNSGGLGTMGFCVPAAIGAKVGRPDRMVWAVDGDGCFQMTAQELVTAASERIPVKVAILNNAYLGMVRQWQEMFYEERYSEVYLSPDLPDYKMWAESMGCIGMRVESPEEVLPAIEKANQIDDRPVVIDFRTDSREKVYPMVASGTTNDQIVVDPSQGQGGR